MEECEFCLSLFTVISFFLCAFLPSLFVKSCLFTGTLVALILNSSVQFQDHEGRNSVHNVGI